MIKFDHVPLPVGGQYHEGVVELSHSATVEKPESKRKANRINDETSSSNKEKSEKGN